MVAGIVLSIAVSGQALVAVAVQNASPTEAVCRVSSPPVPPSPERLTRTADGFLWDCLSGESLQCDATGFEPIDVPAPPSCGGAIVLSFRKARPAFVEFDGSARVEIRADAKGGSRLIAARTFTDGAAIGIAEGGRLARVFRTGFAPNTLFLEPGDRVRLSPSVGGGELSGRVLLDRVRPQSVVVVGSILEAPVGRLGHFSLSGLAPGRHNIRAKYRGGILSDSMEVELLDMLTTEVAEVGVKDAGGAVTWTAPSVCGPATTLALTRLVTSLRTVTPDRIATAGLDLDSCDGTFEGLKPGRYAAEVVQKDTDDLRAAADFQVESGVMTLVTISSPEVILEGVVKAGTAGRVGIQLTLTRTDSTRRTWRTVTSSEGNFRIDVDRPGQYLMEIRSAKYLPGVARTIRLEEGLNHFDWTLPSSRLLVKVRNADGSNPTSNIQITVDSTADSKAGFIVPTEPPEAEFLGLPFGHYRVTATAAGGWVATNVAIADIGDKQPSVELTLVLDRKSSVLTLVAADGSPVQAALVRAGPRQLDEISPGVFAVEGTAPGSQLLIAAPGFAPMCHTLRSEEFPALTRVLTRGRESALIRFTPPIPNPIGEFYGFPNSDCPVPMSLTSVSMSVEDNSSVVRVTGLPAGTYQYRPTRATMPQQVLVPGAEVVFRKPVK